MKTVASKEPRFQKAIDAVQALPRDEQDMLVEIVRRRQIEARRDELADSIRKADKEYRSGKMPGGSIEQVLEALNHD